MLRHTERLNEVVILYHSMDITFYIIIFTIILICAIVNNEKKVASQYKNNGLPITITHIVIVEKVMVKCVIVEQL